MELLLLIYLLLTCTSSLKSMTLNLSEESTCLARSKEAGDKRTMTYEAPAGCMIRKVIYNNIEIYSVDEKDNANRRIVTREYSSCGIFLQVDSIYDENSQVSFYHITDSFITKYPVKYSSKPVDIPSFDSWVDHFERLSEKDSVISSSPCSQCLSYDNHKEYSDIGIGISSAIHHFEGKRVLYTHEDADVNEIMGHKDRYTHEEFYKDVSNALKKARLCTKEAGLSYTETEPSKDIDSLNLGDDCTTNCDNNRGENSFWIDDLPGDNIEYENARSIMDHVIALNEMSKIEYDISEYIADQNYLKNIPFTLDRTCSYDEDCALGSFRMGEIVEPDDGYFENSSVHSDPETYVGGIGRIPYAQAQDMQFTSSIDMSNVVNMPKFTEISEEPKNADTEEMNTAEGNSTVFTDPSFPITAVRSEQDSLYNNCDSTCRDFDSDTGSIEASDSANTLDEHTYWNMEYHRSCKSDTSYDKSVNCHKVGDHTREPKGSALRGFYRSYSMSDIRR
ncbi:signal peptide containing protein [Theileria equi strain WA]|uniref:Signal peptide containing protein n=1 Tax=Theileria equi strain WA TaxID=1537102 RepID=L1LDW6_THEEQ|nr:signal peptide containing protein [Theileria equi strain WA]EKX73338.1 signal peptide containing protein [Theileria equi strain WA]|eukprot:XP_004832790.1 signal peptide containing protein [Theileria equi strain WA]